MGAVILALLSVLILDRWRTTRLVYDIGESMVCRYSKIDAACEVLSGCDRLWRQTSKGYTSDWKRNAGASTIMQRVPVTLSRRRMPYLKSNFVPWVFASDGLMLAFYLDRLYIWDGKQYDAVDYADMEIDASLSHYREQEQVPSTPWLK